MPGSHYPDPPRCLNRIAWLLFVLSFALLAALAAPGVAFHDSGEFALAAAVRGLPHPPCAPTWCLSALAFVGALRPLLPGADIAYLTNLHSAFWGAATIGLVAALAGRWSWRLWGSLPAAIAGQLAAPALLLYSGAFLEQATLTEQYTLLTALMAAAFLQATELEERPTPRGALLLGLLIALAIGNHLSQAVLLLLPVWTLRGQKLRLAATALAGLLLGLCVFVYLPLRSAANPVLDFGNPETLDRFVAALTRQQWQSRPLSAAPAGFATEWLQTYDFPGQLGWAGVGLALAGVALLARRSPVRLIVALTVGLAYAAGLLLVHLKQQGIDLIYLRGYGVTDWHIPLYTLAALLAGVGAAGITSRYRWAVGGAALLALVGAGAALARHSLHGWRAPDTFVADLLRPTSPDSLILASSDDVLLPLSYRAYGTSAGLGGRWVDGGGVAPLPAIGRAVRDTRPFDRAGFLQAVVRDPDNPLHPPAPAADRAAHAPLLVEYRAGNALAGRFLKPAGYLFEVRAEPVSDNEAVRTEAALQTTYPELFRPPAGGEHRLEREARGLMHQNRAAYFFERGLWREAAAAYTLACAYLPGDGRAWCCLATAREALGNRPGAAEAYAEAINAEPHLAGPRTNLGILLAQAGQLDRARTLLEEELRWNPQHAAARANLAIVLRQLPPQTP